MAEINTGGSRVNLLPIRESETFGVHVGKGMVVTGGTGGIGKAMVELLLAQGAKVLVADLKPETVEATVQELGGAKKGCFGVAMDVASEVSVAAGITQGVEVLGQIDGLVNCAAVAFDCDPLAITRADWQRVFEIDLFGGYEVARVVARHMIDRGIAGAIVLISSEAGKKGHVPYLAYSAAKAGVISMARMLSEALAPHDINVNCVCPGGVDTPILRQVASNYAKFMPQTAEALFDQIKNRQLLRHIQPIEVARIMSFLLSSDAMLIRGQALNVDAGETWS
jgi:NAD(P)-dependent dehydrogenase (short-subunit alcohol dehydrogenase family)